MKKIVVFLFTVFLLSCSNSNRLEKLPPEKQEKIIKENFNDLTKKFFILIDDKIKEKDRADLESNYINLKNQIRKIKLVGTKEHVNFLLHYSKLIDIKIQYLKDLK